MDDDLATYLDALARGECYRVDAVLKENALEMTERVFLIVADGTERGPFIRKRMKIESGLGEAYERLWRAQKAGKRFMHLPRIVECGVDGDDRIVIMEHVDGATLDELVQNSSYTDGAALTISGLLCDAVMELHECFDPPMIHRDLKPENVIISPSNLTLIDLGIARTFDKDAERDTRSFGTRGYAPPEQFGYGQTDERSDIYALGMLIAYCFLREDPERRLVESEFADERIPESLRPVLACATSFDPERRYKSVRAMKDSPDMATTLAEMESAAAYVEEEDAAHASKGAMSAPAAPPPPQTSQICNVDRVPGSSRPVSLPPQAPSVSNADNAMKDRRSFATIPQWVGIIWNVLVIATWTLFAIAAISVTFFPVEGDTFVSPLARGIISIGIFLVGLAPIAFGLLDKSWLKRRFALLRRFAWWKVLLFCVAVGLAIMLASAVIGTVINEAVMFSASAAG